jgi:hypothetical protein
MALITGIPNFFSNATPTATDFNNAAKAIGLQVGAEYFDPAIPGYVQSTGNLDSTNLATTSALKNSQKAESFSYFSINFTTTVNAVATVSAVANVVTAWTLLPLIPPLGMPYFVTQVHVSSGGGHVVQILSSAFVKANTLPSTVFSLLVNDSTVASIVPGSMPESAELPVHLPVGSVSVGPNDSLTLDISQLQCTSQLLGGGSNRDVLFNIVCKTPHVRSAT